MKLKKAMGLLFSLMAAVVTLSVLSFPVEAAETGGVCGKDLTWSFEEGTGTLTIEGSGEMEQYTSGNKAPWNSLRNSIKTVVIGKNVTGLGNYAFHDCKALTEIRFHATAMEDLTENNYVFNLAGQNSSGITLTVGANVTKIPAYLFNTATLTNRPNIKKVVFENGSVCESIGAKAFYYCDTLAEVNLPDSLKTIGDFAFDCTSLSQINLGNRLTEIGKWAFSSTNITELAIPDSVITIGDYAFHGCRSLTSLTLGNSVKTIGANAFEYCAGLTSVTIPDSVTTIGDYAFNDCDGLTDVKLGKRVATLGESAFQSCSGLTAITLPDSLTEIGMRAFYLCVGLEQITIPDSVTQIGSAAFYNCTGLKRLSIGKGVKSLDGAAFENCTALTEIYFNAAAMYDPMNINNYIFTKAGHDGNGISVTIGAAVTRIPEGLFCPYGFSGADEYSPKVISVTFEEGSVCKEIANSAFQWCQQLTSITLPAGLTTIGDSAFAKTGITAIVIPDSVSSMRSSAFSGCKGLESVTLGNGITKINSSVFYACSNLRVIHFGNAVNTIDSDAFYGCESLESLRLPDSVKTINGYAFENCTNLATVYVTSPGFVANMTVSWACGNLIRYAKTVMIGSSIDSVPQYITETYPYRYSAVYEGTAFTAYSQTPLAGEHEHIPGETWKSNGTSHWQVCVSCGGKAGDSLAHEYDDACDGGCNICGAIRTIPHSYDNACDTDCNACGKTRTIMHTYDDACDTDCNVCTNVRTTSHTYDNACDTDCNSCGNVRSTSHDYADGWSMDDEGHWHECTVCKEKTDEAVHEWQNETVTREATAEKEGERTYTCLCGATRAETIPRLADNLRDDANSDDPPAGRIVPVIVVAGVVCLAAIVIVVIFVKKRSK